MRQRIGKPQLEQALSEAQIHKLLGEVLKNCPKSRAEIADKLTSVCGVPISEGMLNDWCRETKTRLRFPLSLVRAICEITGNDDLALAAMRDSLRERAELGSRAVELRRLLAEMAEKASALAEREKKSAKTRQPRRSTKQTQKKGAASSGRGFPIQKRGCSN